MWEGRWAQAGGYSCLMIVLSCLASWHQVAVGGILSCSGIPQRYPDAAWPWSYPVPCLIPFPI